MANASVQPCNEHRPALLSHSIVQISALVVPPSPACSSSRGSPGRMPAAAIAGIYSFQAVASSSAVYIACFLVPRVCSQQGLCLPCAHHSAQQHRLPLNCSAYPCLRAVKIQCNFISTAKIPILQNSPVCCGGSVAVECPTLTRTSRVVVREALVLCWYGVWSYRCALHHVDCRAITTTRGD